MARKKTAIVEATADEAMEVVATAAEPTDEPVSGVRYSGGGFLLGIPARDLSPDEWQALSESQRTAALQSQLYSLEGGG